VTTIGLTFFDTSIGPMAIAWSNAGIVGVQLPEHGEGGTRARVLRRWPDGRDDTPPPTVSHAIDLIIRLLRGERVDLSPVAVDTTHVPSFDRRVYEVARAIQPGSTVTYGDIARRLGDPGSARAVGRALGRNPFPIVVPCHRVVAADGKLGGFSAAGGAATKWRLLEIEGALPDATRHACDQPSLFPDAEKRAS